MTIDLSKLNRVICPSCSDEVIIFGQVDICPNCNEEISLSVI